MSNIRFSDRVPDLFSHPPFFIFRHPPVFPTSRCACVGLVLFAPSGRSFPHALKGQLPPARRITSGQKGGCRKTPRRGKSIQPNIGKRGNLHIIAAFAPDFPTCCVGLCLFALSGRSFPHALQGQLIPARRITSGQKGGCRKTPRRGNSIERDTGNA